MTTIEFLKKKNQILREYLGLNFDLVPEEQMINVPFKELSNETSAGGCPYCVEYLNAITAECTGCPMTLAGNSCEVDENDTWTRYISEVKFTHVEEKSEAYEPMNDLIKEYNESNKLPPE